METDFFISCDRSFMQLETIHGFLKRSHWAHQRPVETIVKSIKNSLCYGVFLGKRQVAFARIVTDYSTFAYLCDVFVDEDFRGLGISKKIMVAIMENPDLQNIRRFLLATLDAHTLYARYGFEKLSPAEVERFMVIRKYHL